MLHMSDPVKRAQTASRYILTQVDLYQYKTTLITSPLSLTQNHHPDHHLPFYLFLLNNKDVIIFD